MITMEQVEKLREKANVTYDEAKNALETANGDMLDALIYLERQGKTIPPKNGGYYQSESMENKNADESTDKQQSASETEQTGQSFTQLLRKFLRWCGALVRRGNVNAFEVWKQDSIIISLPVTALALLLVFAFWITLPLLILGLFFGFRYMFKGPDFGKDEVNNFMSSAADTADSIKKEVAEEMQDKK